MEQKTEPYKLGDTVIVLIPPHPMVEVLIKNVHPIRGVCFNAALAVHPEIREGEPAYEVSEGEGGEVWPGLVTRFEIVGKLIKNPAFPKEKKLEAHHAYFGLILEMSELREQVKKSVPVARPAGLAR